MENPGRIESESKDTLLRKILNSNSIILQVFLWITLYALWILVFRNHSITVTRTMGIEFCYLVFIGMNYYFNVYIGIRRFLYRKRYGQFILGGLLFIAFTSWMRAEVAVFISAHSSASPAAYHDFGALYLNSLLNIFIWTTILVCGKLLIDKISSQKYIESVEKDKLINELNFLRAQNNPHFLFNTLNSIYFQIDKTNPDARESLMKLSEMLRYQLYECNEERISIEKEISFLKNYIELQKLRLNANYVIDLNIANEVKNFYIAPLLIMPLIENAFKYVSHYTDRNNEINISLDLNDGIFQCQIKNSLDTFEKNKDSIGGIGLKNLERRLELLYPDAHEMTVNNDGLFYEVILKIRINEN